MATSLSPLAADVAWVRPPEPIRGLDHLGAQAPCTALYAQLLPGITNVTDRARYYSFHPWSLWAFERRYTDHSLDGFRRVLRRAECLFALIGIRHARSLPDADEGLHGAGMVGRFELLRIGHEAEIQLDDFAALEGKKRYFKNKLGGLGQYYFGPLRDLRILDHSPQGIPRTRPATIVSAVVRSPRRSRRECPRTPSSAYSSALGAGPISTRLRRSVHVVSAAMRPSTVFCSIPFRPARRPSRPPAEMRVVPRSR